MDITDIKALENYLERIKPHYVINCVGILVSRSRDDISSAIFLNSYLPNLLSKLGNRLGYKLVHISTDCVFSGRDGQYTETSYRDGDDNYARTKALGEVVNDKDLTIRTSIIGPELKANGTGLLDWFLKQEGTINGYTQAYWSGVTTLELAKAVVQFLQQDVTGLYHLCIKDKTSKYALLKLLVKVWDGDIEVVPFEDYKVDKSLVCTRRDFDYPTVELEKMLLDIKQWMRSHAAYYPQYEKDG